MTVLRLQVHFIAYLMLTVKGNLRIQYVYPGNHPTFLQEVQSNCISEVSSLSFAQPPVCLSILSSLILNGYIIIIRIATEYFQFYYSLLQSTSRI
jgi:hypothetical protein